MFWRLTLAEWRATLDGYAEKQRGEMQRTAWLASHLLIAAGCDAGKVTVAKLLGEEEPKSRRRVLGERERKLRDAQKLWDRMQKKRLANGE